MGKMFMFIFHCHTLNIIHFRTRGMFGTLTTLNNIKAKFYIIVYDVKGKISAND